MMDTTLTAAERAGIEQFRASMAAATRQRMETTMQALQPGGSVERRQGAPRREVLDEMARILRVALAPATDTVAPVAASREEAVEPAATATRGASMEQVVIAGTACVPVEIVAGKDFNPAVKAARNAGGAFDSKSKCWFIPASCDALSAPNAYGWRYVAVAEVKRRRAAARGK